MERQFLVVPPGTDYRYTPGEGHKKGSSVDAAPIAFLVNAFSLSMLDEDALIEVKKVEAKVVRNYRLYSCVGHKGAAEAFSSALGINISVNREAISLSCGNLLFVGQIQGRLPEGKVLTTEEMPSIEWWRVVVKAHPDTIAQKREEEGPLFLEARDFPSYRPPR